MVKLIDSVLTSLDAPGSERTRIERTFEDGFGARRCAVRR